MGCIKACFVVYSTDCSSHHFMPVSEPSSSSTHKYQINIEGKLRVFTSMLPMDKIDSMFGGSSSPKQVFMYAWFDKDNGASAHVAAPFEGEGGQFRLKMPVYDGINPSLKLHASVRTKDQESKNVRTFTLAVSSTDLETLLSGREDCFAMEDQFMAGNFVQVSMRISNAQDFRNHPSCANNMSKPLIRMGVSALAKVAESNRIMERVSNELQASIQQNKMVVAPGVVDFQQGLTRLPPFPLPSKPVLFLSLMLGAPAYVFLLPATQSGVRREEVLDPRQCFQQHAFEGPGDAQHNTCAGGHSPPSVPLCCHACPRGDAAERTPRGPGALPSSSEAGPHWRDSRVHAQAARRSIWDVFRAVPAVHLRRGLGSIPEGRDCACCLEDQGYCRSTAQLRPWNPS